MFSFSIKQLLRQPGKAILFFLLMAASTALVVTGAVLTIENNKRLRIVEETYSTIGYVEQLPISSESTVTPNPCFGTDRVTTTDYGEFIHPEDLDFPGADYVMKPEHRPYYIFYEPNFTDFGADGYNHVLEFTPLKSVGPEDGAVEVELTKVLFSTDDDSDFSSAVTTPRVALHEGEHITVCQCRDTTRYPMEAGERYVAALYLYSWCDIHGANEYAVSGRPYSGLTDREGNYIGKESFPDEIDWGKDSPRYAQIAHVTGDDFYEKGNIGYNYLQWAKNVEESNNNFAAVATNALELLPSWHEGKITLREGREITPEEFESGAPVCMISKEFAGRNGLKVGDKVNMPFLYASYWDTSTIGGQSAGASKLGADGEFLTPFFEQEYEIVGLTECSTRYEIEAGPDVFIIPANSVTVGHEDRIAYCQPITRYTCSFQIPNGSIQKFDKALKENFPDAERLSVTYDDRGYSEIKKSLDNSRAMALLLLLAGIMAALSIVALLLYFFVVKEKKRTAVERSLGMTKRQCRVSLLSALMILTVLSASIGSICGTLALDRMHEPQVVAKTAQERDSMYAYDTRYSTWAAGRELAEKAEINVDMPVYVHYAVPLCLSVLVLVFALLLMAVSFKTDPIYLLSIREKE